MSAGEIPMLVGFVVFILFPLWVVFLTLRRGQPDLSVLTFVTMFVGLGPLVGLLALLRLAGRI